MTARSPPPPSGGDRKQWNATTTSSSPAAANAAAAGATEGTTHRPWWWWRRLEPMRSSCELPSSTPLLLARAPTARRWRPAPLPPFRPHALAFAGGGTTSRVAAFGTGKPGASEEEEMAEREASSPGVRSSATRNGPVTK
jgi:hypothetical protein